MSEAIQRGYYDTPRECSLTDLAAALEISKSTASVVLHNAEETIIKEFFANQSNRLRSSFTSYLFSRHRTCFAHFRHSAASLSNSRSVMSCAQSSFRLVSSG